MSGCTYNTFYARPLQRGSLLREDSPLSGRGVSFPIHVMAALFSDTLQAREDTSGPAAPIWKTEAPCIKRSLCQSRWAKREGAVHAGCRPTARHLQRWQRALLPMLKSWMPLFWPSSQPLPHSLEGVTQRGLRRIPPSRPPRLCPRPPQKAWSPQHPVGNARVSFHPIELPTWRGRGLL